MDEQEWVDEAIERSLSTRLAKMYARDVMASFAKNVEREDQRSDQEMGKEKDAVEEKEAQDGIASSSTTETKKNLMHADKKETIIKCAAALRSQTRRKRQYTVGAVAPGNNFGVIMYPSMLRLAGRMTWDMNVPTAVQEFWLKLKLIVSSLLG